MGNNVCIIVTASSKNNFCVAFMSIVLVSVHETVNIKCMVNENPTNPTNKIK